MRRLVPMVMVMVMGVALLASCGDNAASQPAAAPAAAATPTTAVETTPPSSNAPSLPASTTVTTVAAPGTTSAAVPEALAFKAPLVGGGELNLADYAGKPVLLWFWAPT
jgi:hypothetical protein